jgi:NAD(P)-dependent dehydrogenase (short-subunit alcohol dehydrogenase family)
MNTDLTGKVAFVTGGGSGIGAATSRTLAAAGAAVAIVDFRLDAAQAVAEEITTAGGRALAVAADVRDEAAVAAAVRQTVVELGGVQLVFANAGINVMRAPIEELTLDEWHATIDTNLTGTFLTTKHTIPHLRAAGGGAIVITASVNGTRQFSVPGFSAYSTSKAGQATFARMAATELARWNIRVNTILPGMIRTNIGERTYQRNLEQITYDIKMPAHFPPLGARTAEPSEVADAVLYLLSDASRYVTGTELLIDAGLTLLRG